MTRWEPLKRAQGVHQTAILAHFTRHTKAGREERVEMDSVYALGRMVTVVYACPVSEAVRWQPVGASIRDSLTF